MTWVNFLLVLASSVLFSFTFVINNWDYNLAILHADVEVFNDSKTLLQTRLDKLVNPKLIELEMPGH